MSRALGWLVLGAVLVGCGGTSSNNPEPPEMRVVNGMIGETLIVSVDGVTVGNPIPYGSGGPGTDGAFFRLDAGVHSLRVATQDGTVLVDQPVVNFRQDEMTTLFASGTELAPSLIGSTDYRSAIDFGRANLRVANRWTEGPGAFDLYVTRPEDTLDNRIPLAENVAVGASLGPYVIDGGALRYRLCSPGTKNVIDDETLDTKNGLSAILVTDDPNADGQADLIVVP